MHFRYPDDQPMHFRYPDDHPTHFRYPDDQPTHFYFCAWRLTASIDLMMDRRSSLSTKKGSEHSLDGAPDGVPQVKVKVSRNGFKFDIPRVEGDADNVRNPWMRLTCNSS
jgi:hypothetical protein